MQQREPGKTLNVRAAIALVVIVAAIVAAIILWHGYGGLSETYRASQVPTPTPAYGNVMAVTRDPSLPTAVPSLRRGSRGERVLALQQRLTELGYYSGELDGQFGPGTEEAVMRFQIAAGLEPDGYAGEVTLNRLSAADAPAVPAAMEEAEPPAQAPAGQEAAPQATEAPAETETPAPASVPAVSAAPLSGVLRRGSSGSEVRALQSRLIQLGYLTGTADGQFGPGTKAAVQAFQQVNGLTSDGEVGPATWAALFSDTVIPKPSPIPLPELDASAARPYVRPDGLPLVVNKTTRLPEGYQPLQLVSMNDACPADLVTIKHSGTQAEAEAVDALLTMLSAAREEGVGNWQVSAAYRSVEDQERIMADKVEDLISTNGLSRSRAQQAARNTVADPGASEHHLGTCFDITVPGTSQFKGTPQHRWLVEHCWEYGFILRYPEDKERITGYAAEAWHYRWVGQPHARIMHEEGLCLEEYVAKYGVN